LKLHFPEGFSLLKTEGLGAVNAQISTEIRQRCVRGGLPESLLKRRGRIVTNGNVSNSLRRKFSEPT